MYFWLNLFIYDSDGITSRIFKNLADYYLVLHCFQISFTSLAPFFLRSIARKMERQFNQNEQPFNAHKEGEVSIDKMPHKETSNKDVGEYIDYEEID